MTKRYQDNGEDDEEVWLVEDLDVLVKEVEVFRGTSQDAVSRSLAKCRMALQVSLWRQGKTTRQIRRKKFSDLCDALDDLVYAAENGDVKTRQRISDDDGVQLCLQILRSKEHWELWVVVMYLLAIVAEDPACKDKLCSNEALLAIPYEFLARHCTPQESDVATKLLLAMVAQHTGKSEASLTLHAKDAAIGYAIKNKNLAIIVASSNKLRGIAVDRLDKILRMIGGPEATRVIHISVLGNDDLFTLLKTECAAVLRAVTKELAERATRGLLVPIGAPALAAPHFRMATKTQSGLVPGPSDGSFSSKTRYWNSAASRARLTDLAIPARR